METYESSVIITDSTFSDNAATAYRVGAGLGGVMYTTGSSFIITANILLTIQLTVVVSYPPHLIHHLILPTVLLLITVQLMLMVLWPHRIHY